MDNEQTEILSPAGHSLRKVTGFSRTPWKVKIFTSSERLAYRGVTVYPSPGGFYFVESGVILTERAGMSKAKDVIDDYRDGTTKSNACKYHAFECEREAAKYGEWMKENLGNLEELIGPPKTEQTTPRSRRANRPDKRGGGLKNH